MSAELPRLPYYKLQEIRQTNILRALQSETTTPERLLQLFDVAHEGLKLAVRQGAIESDAVTFLNLEADIRAHLEESTPTTEYM